MDDEIKLKTPVVKIPYYLLENNISPPAILLYGKLLDLQSHMDYIKASRRTLASYFGWNDIKISRLIKELRDADCIKVQYSKKQGKTNWTIQTRVSVSKAYIAIPRKYYIYLKSQVITAIEVVTLALIYDKCFKSGAEYCYWSNQEIGNKLHKSYSRVSHILSELKHKGMIEINLTIDGSRYLELTGIDFDIQDSQDYWTDKETGKFEV